MRLIKLNCFLNSKNKLILSRSNYAFCTTPQFTLLKHHQNDTNRRFYSKNYNNDHGNFEVKELFRQKNANKYNNYNNNHKYQQNKRDTESKNNYVGRSARVDDSKGLDFDTNVYRRHSEAKRSVLFTLQRLNNDEIERGVIDLYERLKFVENLKVVKCFHFQARNKPNVLVEFESEKDVDYLIKNRCKQFHNDFRIPVTTRMLMYHCSESRQRAKTRLDPNIFTLDSNCHLANDTDQLLEYLKNEYKNNLDEQMYNFCKLSRLDEFGTRIRYFFSSLIEDLLRCLFNTCACLPFGSSSNGFGKVNCDLDMVILFNSIITKDEGGEHDKPFHFVTKQVVSDEKVQSKHLLSVLEHMLSKFIPLVEKVYFIQHAMVPIIKLDSHITSPPLNCDLSITIADYSQSFCMANLLWTYANYDYRVVTLVFLLKKWKDDVGVIINNTPGAWPTSYQLIGLIFFYLIEKNVMPPVDHLIENYDTLLNYSEKVGTKNRQTLPFKIKIKNISQLKRSNSNATLSDLFYEFFKYYSNFDFTKNITLDSRRYVDELPNMHFIANPLAPNVNIARNVKPNMIKHFKECCQITVQCIENEIKQGNKLQNINLDYIFKLIKDSRHKSTVSGYNSNDEIFDDNKKFTQDAIDFMHDNHNM